MNFNSIGSSSDFSRAGKAAADELVRIHAANRNNAPDMGKIVTDASTRRSKEKIAATKAQSEVARVGITTQGNVKSDRIVRTAERKRDKSKRKAGALATAGKLFGTAGSYLGEKRTKREVGAMDGYYDKLIQQNTDNTTQLTELIKSFNSDDSTTNTNSSSTGNTGGSDTGKVDSSTDTATNTSTKSDSSSNSGGTLAQSYGKNWNALQTVIRHVEGTKGEKGYTTRFGGHQFSGFDAHPNIAAPTPWGTKSEAAGAFQFMKPTWDEARAALNLTDFSPKSQQEAGRFLTDRRGVNPDADLTDFGAFTGAISKLSPEWAGLPNTSNGRTGYHGQANADMKELHQLYLKTLNGGL